MSMNDDFEDEKCLSCGEVGACILPHVLYRLYRIYYGYCLECGNKWYHTDRLLHASPTLCCDIHFGWRRFKKRREKEVKKLLESRFYRDVGTIISELMFGSEKKTIKLI
jgi:hypothetical protein